MKNSIEKKIQELATANMNLYPADWNVKLQDVKDQIIETAESYFDNRNDDEVKRDEDHNIEISDYIIFISMAWCSWIEENKDWTEITNVQELFDWAGEDLENDHDFDRDLRSSEIFHPSFNLIDEDDYINFNFKIIEDKGFYSDIEFMSCESV